MAKMRSITTLTSNHIGLYIKIIDADQTYKGQLTDFEAALTHSPNEHPSVWHVGINGEQHAVSSAATWKRLPRRRPGRTAGEVAKEAT